MRAGRDPIRRVGGIAPTFIDSFVCKARESVDGGTPGGALPMPDLFFDQPHIELMSPDWPGRCEPIWRDNGTPRTLLRTDFRTAFESTYELHGQVLEFRKEPTRERARPLDDLWRIAARDLHTLPIDDHASRWLFGQLQPWYAECKGAQRLPKGYDRNKLMFRACAGWLEQVDDGDGIPVINFADRETREKLTGEQVEPAAAYRFVSSYADLVDFRDEFPSGFVAFPDFTRIKRLVPRLWGRWKTAFGSDSSQAVGAAANVRAEGWVSRVAGTGQTVSSNEKPPGTKTRLRIDQRIGDISFDGSKTEHMDPNRQPFKLLIYFAEHPDVVFSAEDLGQCPMITGELDAPRKAVGRLRAELRKLGLGGLAKTIIQAQGGWMLHLQSDEVEFTG